MPEPNYLQMWAELAKASQNNYAAVFQRREKAENYDVATKRKNQGQRDILLEMVISTIRPGDTVLDVGAGTGRWTIPLAKVAARTIAVDPSPAMLDILKRNADTAGVTKRITIVTSTWENVLVDPADIVVSFHAIYMAEDFATFVNKMEAHAKKYCYLGLRNFPVDGIIQELSLQIHGTIHDSPNFIIGYNALRQMGIYANVTIESFRHNWRDNSLEDAFRRAKRHLRLENENRYDSLISETLFRRLELVDCTYLWPDSMSTAMIWWQPQHI